MVKTHLRIQVDGEGCICDLPNDAEFLNELRLSMKIEKFFTSSSANNMGLRNKSGKTCRNERTSIQGKLFLKSP